MPDIFQQVQVVVFRVDLAQFWGGHFEGVWRECPSLYDVWHWSFMFHGVMLEFCNKFQVVTFPVDLVQFWGSGGVPHHLKCLALVIYYS